MNNTFIKFAGSFLLAFAAVAVIYKIVKKSQKQDADNSDEFIQSGSKINSSTDTFVDVKENSCKNISDRHKEASEIVERSIENVFNEKVQGAHSDALDNINNDLNTLLGDK